jgi:hypothetical protein
VSLPDGTVICGATPCTWTAPKGSQPIKLTYELAGYDKRTRAVLPDQTRGMSTELAKTATKVSDKPAGHHHGGSRKPKPAPAGDDPFKPIE